MRRCVTLGRERAKAFGCGQERQNKATEPNPSPPNTRRMLDLIAENVAWLHLGDGDAHGARRVGEELGLAGLLGLRRGGRLRRALAAVELVQVVHVLVHVVRHVVLDVHLRLLDVHL